MIRRALLAGLIALAIGSGLGWLGAVADGSTAPWVVWSLFWLTVLSAAGAAAAGFAEEG